MVGGSDVDLSSVLSILASKKSNLDDKIEAYASLCSNFKEDELSFIHLDVAKQADRVLAQLKKDISHDSPAISQSALQILGYCLHDQETVRFICAVEATSILKSLCGLVDKTEEKTTCTRALWCVGKQAFSADIVAKQVPALISSCEQALSKWKGQSPTVEYEIVCVIARLLAQVAKPMGNSCLLWVKLLMPLAVHPAIKIREKVITLFEENLTMLTNTKGLAQGIAAEFKSKISAEIKILFAAKNELMMLRLWKVVVTCFGEQLHHGTSLINQLLSIAELGFKHGAAAVKVASFEAWRTLIDNFATNPSVLSDPKRMKLVMQVLKLNNTKKEPVAMAQFETWWHFVKLLGPKLSVYFEQVMGPLLSFCLGGTKLTPHTLTSTPGTPHAGLKSAISSPLTPRLNLSSTTSTSTTFSALQKKGCEVLARILACQKVVSELPATDFAVDELTVDVITGPAMFLKHATLLIHSATELLVSVGADIPHSLLMNIWQSLAFHLRTALTATVKSENREAFSTFLSQFQIIVMSQALSQQSVLSMFKVVCGLPQKSLSSTAYNIKTGEHGEIVMGTPALFLCEVLLTPTLLKSCAGLESYMSHYSQLVNCGVSNATGVLEFCQAVTDLIDRNAEFIPNVEAMWRLWSVVANTLHEHILKTNEVNQGDSLEYNFSCLYTLLLLPVKHGMGTKMSSAVSKTMLKTWSDVYRSFARMAALVPNARANTVCEEFSQKIQHCLSEEDLKDAGLLDFLSQICEVIINSVDFSSFGSTFNFNSAAPSSPSKWLRKKKPMDNLHTFVTLMSQMVEALVLLSTPADGVSTPRQKGGAILTSAASGIIDVLTMLFTHVSTSNIISNMLAQLSPPLGRLFHSSTSRSTNKFYSPAFMQKLEKLWLDISTCIQSRYSMTYDSDFLSHISPLLEVNFLHPRRQIKNQTVILWNATFSHSAPLAYPEELKSVLMKVKEKTPISLPGFVACDVAVIIEETPLSQLIQGDSQAPEPHLPGLPSPRKIVGSFLHKAVSPSVKKSPAKPVVVSPKAVSSVRKKLKIDDFREDDFVVISTTPKRKRVLTDHQKEVLKEKKILPTMYSSLDASVDMSLMAQFTGSDTQNSESQNLVDSVISINSTQSQPEDSDKTEKPESQKHLPTDFSNSFSPPGSTGSELDSNSVASSDAPTMNTRRRSRRSVTFGLENNNVKKPDMMDTVIEKPTEQCKQHSDDKESQEKKKSVSRRKKSVDPELSSKTVKECKKPVDTESSTNTVKESKESGTESSKKSLESKDSGIRLSSRQKLMIPESKESGTESSKTNESSGKESSAGSGKSDDKASISSGDVPASDSLKRNLLHATGFDMFDITSSKSTSSSDQNHSFESEPSLTDQPNDVPHDGLGQQIEKHSQEVDKLRSKLIPEAAKQSPVKKKVDEIVHRQLSPVRISFSQDDLVSPHKEVESPRRKCVSQDALSSVKSPTRRTRGRHKSLPVGNSCLDAWLVKSPAKLSTLSKQVSENHTESLKKSHWLSSSFSSAIDESCHGIPESQLSRTLVEDTQSPTKFLEGSKVVESPHVLVEETPVKETSLSGSDPLGLHLTSRNLFGNDSGVLASQSAPVTSLPFTDLKDRYKSITFVTPVVCISKLSPQRVEEISHISSIKPPLDSNSAHKSTDKDPNSPELSSQGFFATVSKSDASNIVSEILNDTIFSAQIVKSNSQTSGNSVRGFSGILSMEQRQELNETSESSSFDGAQCLGEGNTQESEKDQSAVGIEDRGLTEEMFSQDTERRSSQDETNSSLIIDGYDPHSASTLKGSSKSSSEGNSESSHSGLEDSSHNSLNSPQSEAITYNPKELETLEHDKTSVDDQGVDRDIVEVGHDRKRKQNCPKKVSPSKLRRTPRSRRKSKCRHGGSCCDEASSYSDNTDSEKNCSKKITKKSARNSLKFDSANENNVSSEDQVKNNSIPCNQNISNLTSSLESSIVDDLQVSAGDTHDSVFESPDKENKIKSLKMISGEETPDSRPSSVTPVRRSTTKHKMEEAKRRSSSSLKPREVAGITSLSEGLDFQNQLLQSESSQKKSCKSLRMIKNPDTVSDEVSNSNEDICDDQGIKKVSSLSLSVKEAEIVDKLSIKSTGETVENDSVVSSDLKSKQLFTNLLSEASEVIPPTSDVIPPTADVTMETQSELLPTSQPVSMKRNRKQTSSSARSSPLSLRLRSSRLVLRARHKARGSSQSPRLQSLQRKTNARKAKTTDSRDKDNSKVVGLTDHNSADSVQLDTSVSDKTLDVLVAPVETEHSSVIDLTHETAVVSADAKLSSRINLTDCDVTSVVESADMKLASRIDLQHKTALADAKLSSGIDFVHETSLADAKLSSSIDFVHETSLADAKLSSRNDLTDSEVNSVVTSTDAKLSSRIDFVHETALADAKLSSRNDLTDCEATPTELKDKLVTDINTDTTVASVTAKKTSEADPKPECDVAPVVTDVTASDAAIEKRKSVDSCMDAKEDDMVLTNMDSNKTNPTLTGAIENFLPPLDETPKKSKCKKRSIFAHRVVSSDSKLHTFSKSRFKYSADRGMSIVRRSILKHQLSDQSCISPLKRSHDFTFRPIKVSKINSPSASPSAGILKRRFFHHALPVDSPSPPSKERRVSFAEPVVSGESPKRYKYRRVCEESEKSSHHVSSVTRLSAAPTSQVDSSKQLIRNADSNQSMSCASSDLSQSAGSYLSTQESQLGSKEPVYPDLIGCTESVAKILPQLTSSMWSRGLVQLVKARNINTVGDLCSLSELEIHNLPIRSPKVITVRKALQEMEQQILGKRSRAGAEEVIEKATVKSAMAGGLVMVEDKENVNKMGSVVDVMEEPDPLPSADDALLELDQKECEDLNSSIEDGDEAAIILLDDSIEPPCETEICEMSCDKTTQSGSPIQSSKADVKPKESPSKMNSTDGDAITRAGCHGDEMVSVLENLVQTYSTKGIERFKTDDLFTVHHHLASLSNMVVTAMKKRCSSPPSSQD